MCHIVLKDNETFNYVLMCLLRTMSGIRLEWTEILNLCLVLLPGVLPTVYEM